MTCRQQQLRYRLDSTTSYVTITVGGNDVGFRDVVTTCALPGWLGNCDAAVDAGLRTLRSVLADRLDGCTPRSEARAPDARWR